jgi:hypothetical protein
MSVVDRSHLVLWLKKWLRIKDLRELGTTEIEVHTDTIARMDFEDRGID